MYWGAMEKWGEGKFRADLIKAHCVHYDITKDQIKNIQKKKYTYRLKYNHKEYQKLLDER